MSFVSFGRRLCDTLAAGAISFAHQVDRRKDALPRLKPIVDGDQIGTQFNELFGAVWALTLGAWLLLPMETFANVRAFSVLNAISVEWLWGVALVAFGAVRFDAILMNRARQRHNLSLLGVTLWSALACFLLFGNLASPGGATFLMFAALETLSYRNQKPEAPL